MEGTGTHCRQRQRVHWSYAMARAIQSHTLRVLIAKGESLRYIPAYIIMVRLCAASWWLFFLLAVSSFNNTRKKTTLAVWKRIPHITPHHCYTKYIYLLPRALLNWSITSPVQTPGYWSSTFSHVNEARKPLFVSAIDRYVTLHHRSSLITACKVCSKSSWSCNLQVQCWQLQWSEVGRKMRQVTGFLCGPHRQPPMLCAWGSPNATARWLFHSL